MKRIAALMLGAGFVTAVLAQTPVIDGALDPIYCQALVIQDTQTSFGNATHGQVDHGASNNGSELDNAYAYISGGKLYLFLGGNLEANNNDLEIFFDSRAGGQNQLRTDNPNIDNNGLNRLGGPVLPPDPTAGPGLVFDAGFEADFYLTVQGGNTANGYEIRVHYAELRHGASFELPGVGYFCGTGRYANLTSGGALTGGDPGAPVVRCTINNSNTAGVTGGTGIELDGGAGVATGIEIEIELVALSLVSAAPIKCTAMVNGAQHDFLSNQVLAGRFGGDHVGNPRNGNYNNILFDQHFIIPATTPPCGACCSNQECLVLTEANCDAISGAEYLGNNESCVGNPCDAAATGACCRGTACTIETASECTGGGGIYFNDGSTCDSFPCLTIGACCLPNQTCVIVTQSQCSMQGGDYFGGGSTCNEGLCLTGACCTGLTGTTCQELREDECLAADGTYQGDLTACPNAACVGGACCIGNDCVIVRGGSTCVGVGGVYQGDNSSCAPTSCGGPNPGKPSMDGTCDASYGSALAVQNTQTQFGDSNLGQIDFANGSELDALSARIVSGKLYLCIAGNLESNFNKLDIFFDSRPGGQNTLGLNNPDIDFNGINRMGGPVEPPDPTAGPGLTFDTGFDADFYLGMTHGGQFGRPSTSIFANFAELFVDVGNPGSGTFLGEGRAANYTNQGLLDRNAGGQNPNGIRITLNNSNIAGVTGGDQPQPNGGAGVTTGIEICIPLSALEIEGDMLKVCVFVNGQGHDFASNQFLGGLNGGGNLGEPRNIDLSTVAGDQCVPIPLGPPCGTCGDSNCDGAVTVSDIGYFVTAVASGQAAWDALAGTTCDFICANDTNGDNAVTVGDIGLFVAVVTGQGQCQ